MTYMSIFKKDSPIFKMIDIENAIMLLLCLKGTMSESLPVHMSECMVISVVLICTLTHNLTSKYKFSFVTSTHFLHTQLRAVLVLL